MMDVKSNSNAIFPDLNGACCTLGVVKTSRYDMYRWKASLELQLVREALIILVVLAIILGVNWSWNY